MLKTISLLFYHAKILFCFYTTKRNYDNLCVLAVFVFAIHEGIPLEFTFDDIDYMAWLCVGNIYDFKIDDNSLNVFVSLSSNSPFC